MNPEKQSLQENEKEILAALPAEFHEDFKKQLAALPDTAPTPLTGDAEVAAIKAELKANPDVDEKAAADELKDIKPAKA